MKKYITLCFLFIFLANNLIGQEVKRADKLYSDFGYKATTSIYEKKMQKDKISLSEANIRQIANSYRLFHDTQNAEKWYAQIIKTTSDPKDYLHYAQALQSNGDQDLAKEYYLKYDAHFGDKDVRGNQLATSIDRMNNYKRLGVNIKNESIINTKKIEFSPQYYGNGIVYVTTKPSGLKSKKDIWIDDNFMSLYYTEKNDDGGLNEPSPFSTNLSSKFHEGPVSFSKNGDQIFFTKSNYSKGKRNLSDDGVLKLQIFTAFKKGDKWVKPHSLPFNTTESDEVHPSLSVDGQKLFFASNREGGFGGMDLYVSIFKDGIWNAPINLGPKINTPGNELFPFIHDDGTLYFASNGHVGMGGLDIFSTVTFEEEWSEPVNIGAPINSAMDDLGFTINVLNSEGYFSSDRRNGVGKDDIYSFKVIPDNLKKPIILRLNAEICTIDKNIDDKISNVSIIVSENIHFGDQDDQEYVTDENGNLNIQLDPDKVYAFRAEKNGYTTGNKTFSTEGISASENISFCIGLSSQGANCALISGIVTNARDGSRIPNAIVALTNKCTGTMTSISANLLGEFQSSCMACDCSYSIQGIKSGYYILNKDINLSNLNCDENQSIYYNIQLYSENEDPSLAGHSRLLQPNDPSSLALRVGTRIVLDDIYYDFDKSDIRKDAAESLSKLTGLMRAYPSMEIQLTAHTDSRGASLYNNQLSNKRAESARNYLLANGISGRRISIEGNGEGQIRNHCIEGTKCTEDQHQYNRRTEVRITNLGEENIPISYSKNTSEATTITYNNQKLNSQPGIPEEKLYVSNQQKDYRIQIISLISSSRDFGNLSDLGEVVKEPVIGKDLTRYMISGNLSYSKAMELLPIVKSRGFNRPFIVKYTNGERKVDLD